MGWLIDLIALAWIGCAAWRGWRKGMLPAILRLSGVLVMLFGALFLARPLGRIVQAMRPMPIFIATAVGALAAGMIVSLVFAGAKYGLKRWLKYGASKRADEQAKAASSETPEPADSISKQSRTGGAILGGCASLLTLSFIMWGYGLAFSLAARPNLPDPRGTVTAAVSRFIMRPLIYLMLGPISPNPELRGAVARLAADPGDAVATAREFANNPDVKMLANDRDFADSIMQEDRSAIVNNPSFIRVTENPDLLRSAHAFGWVKDTSNPEACREEIADRLIVIGRKVNQIRNDPDMQALMQDDEFRERIRRGNIAAVLSDPRVQKLADRFMGQAQ